MSKKGTRALASATLMSLVLTSALSVGPVHAAAGQVTRTSGADRYATAAQVAKANWSNGAKDVVLVTGEGYADAVSASALAKQLNAPILLTTADSLSKDAASALETLKPENIYIVGGNASVSQAVRDGLKSNYKLVELGGKNRYETNIAVANQLVKLGVKADNVLLVGGEGFSDALSVAPVAAAKGQILLLGNNNTESMQSVIGFVKTNNSKVTVVGTTNVISEDMYKAIGAIDRVNGGASRFETNMNVLNKYASELKIDKLFVANASGNGYADALVASALAGKTASPLVLVDAEGTAATVNAINFIKSKATKTTDLNVVGGTGVVSDATVNAINNAVNPTNPGKATVQSIEAMNLNQIKVVFNATVDQDSAEAVSNYKIDGVALNNNSQVATNPAAVDANTAVAKLQDDNKTVIITLSGAGRQQYKDYTVSVKKAILTADKTQTIEAFDQKVTMSDITVPTLKSVTVQGNKKLTVEFSEAVNMKTLSTLQSNFKINGQSITSFGVDTTYSQIKDGLVDGANTYASKVEFYFSSALPTGSNTLKVIDGTANGVLSNAAGFSFKETSMNFSVDSVATTPKVSKITSTADGKIYITFDRAMDKDTALNPAYYALNGDSNTLSSKYGLTRANMELKDNDTTIKISGLSGNINTGSNTLYVMNSVKDAYGNKVADDTRLNFTQQVDETKPTIASVSVVDSQTVRVKFSKDVNASYAMSTTNYKLKDSSSVDVTSSITGIVRSNGTTSGNTDTYDIKFTKPTSLTDSKYTLTIKNIVDTTSKQNVMDDYTATINGVDDVSPTVINAVKNSTDATKLVINFSEKMDASTIENLANYRFKNASNDTKVLPTGSKATASADGKSVTIEFPSSYVVKVKTDVTSPSDANADNEVVGISVTGVKDLAGNTLDSITANPDILASGIGSTIKTTSFMLSYDGDDLLATFQFDKAIDTLNKADFTINGVTADSASVAADKVTLRYGKDSLAADGVSKKIELVKATGVATKLVVTPSVTAPTTDISGTKIAANAGVKVYDFAAAPRTTVANWTANTSGTITLTFDTMLDTHSGIKADDFTFTSAKDGKDLKATDVSITNNTVTFTFDAADAAVYFTSANGKTLDNAVSVRAKSTVSIRTPQDADGNYANYTPSTDDQKNIPVSNVK